MKRRVISMTIALLLVVVLAGTAAADDGAVTVTVDGVRVAFIDQEPVIIDNLIMVPLRGVFEALGFTVEWDNGTRTASATSGTHTVLVTIGSDIFTTNGETHPLEGPAQTIGDRTMVPIPAVLESVGVYVDRDAAARTVFIRTSPGPGVQTIAGMGSPGVQTLAGMGSLVVRTLVGTGSHGAADGDPAQFNLPTAVFGSGDALFVADTYNNLIRIIDGYGYVKRFAGNVLARDVSGFPGGAHRDGTALGTRFNRPTGGVVDEQGRIFIADSENHVIRVIIDGNVFTFAGSGDYGYTGGPRDDAQFHLPTAIAIGPCGGLFITDTLNHIIRMICTVTVTATVAGGGTTSAENFTQNFAITVLAAPVPVITITIQPAANITVTEGSITGNLSVVASVTLGAMLSYQWQQNIGGTWTNVGTNSNTLTIPTGLVVGSHQFHVVVSATGDADPVTSNIATVTVEAALPAPVPVITIITQPESTTFPVGNIPDDLSVIASVTLGATLSYQWQQSINGTWTNVGTNSNVLTIPTDLVVGSYQFRVVVSATGGADPVTSAIATVTVEASAGGVDITDNFIDLYFRAAVREVLGIGTDDPIMSDDVAVVTSLVLSDRNIANMAGIEHFSALQTLNASNNNLTDLDVSGLTALRDLIVNNNALATLDVSGLTALQELFVSGNALTTLDASDLTALQTLWAFDNALTTLDVSGLTALQELLVHNNALTTLDVSNNTGLIRLNVSMNYIPNIDAVIGWDHPSWGDGYNPDFLFHPQR